MRMLYPFHTRLYLGLGRALYCGPLQHLEAHVYGAAVLHVGVYRPFRIRLAGGEWRLCRCAVVPPGVRHALDMDGGVHGKLFVEQDGKDAPGFRRRFPRGGACHDAEFIELLRWVCEADPGREEVERRLDALLDAGEGPPVLADGRIRRAVELIAAEPGRNFPREELAALAGLSASRFLHVFREQTGLSYRRLRMWKRLLAAIEALHGSDSLTRSALDAGFADAAHFSHCFRDTFGVNPAPVFRKVKRFEKPPGR